MPYQQQIDSYLQADINARPKEWLVPLLYEHLVKHLRRTEMAIANDDAAAMATSASKATDILYELLGTLDVEAAPEIARPLSGLYSFFISELLRIGRTRDVAALQRITRMCSDLHDAWVKAAEQVAPRHQVPSDRPGMVAAG